MDSVTQFVLGAGVGAAVLGPRIGVRKAVLVGGLLGTAPDLDVLYPFDNPVDAFTLHRGPTHSLFVHAVVTPIFGESLMRVFSGLREQRFRTYLAVFLIFATHALIDAVTVYGTRVFWPLSMEPVGIGSMFIIDPLYTLPLLIVSLIGLFIGGWGARSRKMISAALMISTVYLVWTLAAQQLVMSRVEAYLDRQKIAYNDLFAIPTPFNSVFWKATAITDTHYVNVYVPMFARKDDYVAYVHPRKAAEVACVEPIPALEQVADFSDGFYRLDPIDGEIQISDLRMGLTPGYAFSFAVASISDDGIEPMFPARRENERGADGDIDWLLAGIKGPAIERPVEASVALSRLGDDSDWMLLSPLNATC